MTRCSTHLADQLGSARPEVLIADDDPQVRDAMRCLLDDSGMAVVGEAGDGRAAVELACRLAPDVVVMDLRMPVLSGIDATRRLAAWLPTTRVILCTAYGEAAVRDEAMRAGAAAVVDKVGHPSGLIGAIEATCAGRSDPPGLAWTPVEPVREVRQSGRA